MNLQSNHLNSQPKQAGVGSSVLLFDDLRSDNVDTTSIQQPSHLRALEGLQFTTDAIDPVYTYILN